MLRNTNSLYKKLARRRALPVFALIASIGYVRNAYQMTNLRHALNSFGFGGKNVVLALAKVEPFRQPVS